MNRWAWVLALLLLPAGLMAQPGQPKPDKPTEDGKSADEDRLLNDGLNAYIKKLYPDIDPGGRHDIFKLKSFPLPRLKKLRAAVGSARRAVQDAQTEAKRKSAESALKFAKSALAKVDVAKLTRPRFEYTRAMARLLFIYIRQAERGAMVAKLFDQYARGELGGRATFNCLHAVVMQFHPPTGGAYRQSRKALRKAIQLAPDYEYAHYLLAEMELNRFWKSRGAVSISEGREALNKTLELRPGFDKAKFLQVKMYVNRRPQKLREAEKLIDEVLDAKPDPDTFEFALLLYASITDSARLLEKVEGLLKSGTLSLEQRIRSRLVVAQALYEARHIDETIEWLEQAVKLTGKAKKSPELAREAHRSLGRAWAAKSTRARKDGKDKLAEACMKAADGHILAAAIIERDRMPIALRGPEAFLYVRWLAGQRKDPRGAIEWLDRYLEETDLTRPRRDRLEGERDRLMGVIDPSEERRIETLRKLLSKDDLTELRTQLKREATGNVRDDPFKTEASRDFFIELLKHRDREVVRYAARILAHTADQLGEESRAIIGRVIADRYEKEPECNSDEQGELHEGLCQAIRIAGDRKSQERAVRHLQALIKKTGKSSVHRRVRTIVSVWSDDRFIDGTNEGAAEKMEKDEDFAFALMVGKKKAVTAFLKRLAEHLAKIAK